MLAAPRSVERSENRFPQSKRDNLSAVCISMEVLLLSGKPSVAFFFLLFFVVLLIRRVSHKDMFNFQRNTCTVLPPVSFPVIFPSKKSPHSVFVYVVSCSPSLQQSVSRVSGAGHPPALRVLIGQLTSKTYCRGEKVYPVLPTLVGQFIHMNR